MESLYCGYENVVAADAADAAAAAVAADAADAAAAAVAADATPIAAAASLAVVKSCLAIL